MGLFGPKKVTSVGTSNSGTCAQCGRAFSSGGQKIINGGLTADGSGPLASQGYIFCSVGCAKSFSEGKGWIFK